MPLSDISFVSHKDAPSVSSYLLQQDIFIAILHLLKIHEVITNRHILFVGILTKVLGITSNSSHADMIDISSQPTAFLLCKSYGTFAFVASIATFTVYLTPVAVTTISFFSFIAAAAVNYELSICTGLSDESYIICKFTLPSMVNIIFF